jgi:V/A-type H+-transporting ATPase subunit I
MYFAARYLVLGLDLSPLFAPLGITGLSMIILFMVPVKKLKEEGISFVTFPFDVIANFVDVVSYIRLFAVGSAGVAVAMAFNEMALGMGITGMVLIMLVGHLLNIVLCVMGVLVHGIRLNTLEFSGHMGMTWSGFKYSPFARDRLSGRSGNT